MDINLKRAVSQAVSRVHEQVQSRSFRAANELRNSALDVLRGARNGRVYPKPFAQGTYRASSPGEAPALRTGRLRESWQPSSSSRRQGRGMTANPAITTDLKYAPILDNGSPSMAPRPYSDKVIDKAEPKITAIFSAPFLR